MAIYVKSLLAGAAALAAYIVLAAAWLLFGSGNFVVDNMSVAGGISGSSLLLAGGLGLLIFAMVFARRYRKASRQVRSASR